MPGSSRPRVSSTFKVALLAGAVLLPTCALANDANVVLYNQHTAEKGETEIEIFSDFANVGGDEPDYTAQLFELEHGFTDFWTSAFYLEGAKTDGEDYEYASFRIENCFRLFREVTLLNPVLYAEYEQKEPASQFITAVVGRTDEPEGPPETEHELETRIIFGHDLTDRLTVAFDWINEIKFDNGLWSFGYATGFSYALYKAGGEETERESEGAAAAKPWDVEKVTLGVELYGGVGDADLGLTLDPDKTEQYAGINLETEFDNRFHFTVGGAFGLTEPSQDAILRLSAGYEFE